MLDTKYETKNPLQGIKFAKSATKSMKNKPNLPAARITVTLAKEKTYVNFLLSSRRKNKPNFKPAFTVIKKSLEIPDV
jgi:hypothetical protein